MMNIGRVGWIGHKKKDFSWSRNKYTLLKLAVETRHNESKHHRNLRIVRENALGTVQLLKHQGKNYDDNLLSVNHTEKYFATNQHIYS